MSRTLAADVHPPYAYADYKSTHLRAPKQPLVRVAPSPLETAGPTFPKHFVKDAEADLTTWGKSAPLGEKMVLIGRVLDEDGRPVRRSLVEVWQANASGRYPHPVDRLRTLVATRDPHDPKLYRWDVQLQGAGEAVFIAF